MKFTDFIAKKPLTANDLFGSWTQKGVFNLDDPGAGELAAKVLSWMRTRVKRAIRSKDLKVPNGATCKFKREKTRDNKTSETMIVYAGNGNEIATVVYCAGAFAVNSDGKTVTAPAKENAEKKNGAKSKVAELPLELRHSWTNVALQDRINAEVAEQSVKYWNDNNGKFPKRKIRKPKI